MQLRRCLMAGLSAAVLAASLTAVTPAGAWPRDSDPTLVNDGAHAVRSDSVVTLITGDRVDLTAATTAVVHRRPGADKVTFLSQRVGDDWYVIPSDALPLLRDGRLDRRLFNVTLLREYGYHNGRTDLRLITVGGGGGLATPAAVTTPGVTVMRDLPAVDATAIAVSLDAIGEFWNDLVAGAGAGVSASAPKVWLDTVRQPLLDRSVPQIGAPAAWEQGLDGATVRVAVLDTGIDAAHPDLAGRVVASANFTEGFEQDGDLVGHGTHVASIIAGSGDASGGQYRGVAPGAQLLDAKVCDQFGCLDSWILAGMQWAAEQGAEVVNLSLGGPDTPEPDPLELAVDALTAQYGTLFVISAGNDEVDGSVNSPASADAALAVGAVDVDGELAWFSSRGPRVDGALKPDLTAPGVEIVAANSADGFLGEPGEPYVALSGTSMAAPHVAGAAAILVQQHPQWSPAQLKAALMGAAAPHPQVGPYAQGAGHLDVARAVTQTVTTAPPSVSFARAQWPHDDAAPQTRTVTYHNDGPDDVTLTLDLVTSGPDGGPAPEGFFALSQTIVTVPAEGVAAVSLTTDTSAGDMDGLFGGYLTAHTTDMQVVTPFAVDREPQRFDVTLNHTDRAGLPSSDYWTSLIRTDDVGFAEVFFGPATTTLRVAPGEYTLLSMMSSFGGDEFTLLAQPLLTVDADLTVEVDARSGKPVLVTVPDADARPTYGLMGVQHATDLTFATAWVLADTTEGLFLGRVGPDRAGPSFLSWAGVGLARHDPELGFSASPYSYDLAYFTVDRMMSGLRRDVTRRKLAAVTAHHGQGASGTVGFRAVFGILPGFHHDQLALVVAMELPATRTEYYNADAGVNWDKVLFEYLPVDDGSFLDFYAAVGTAQPATYRAARTYRETWNRAVFGPVLVDRGVNIQAATRSGDALWLFPRVFGDSDGRPVQSFVDGSVTVFHDGVPIAEGPWPEGVIVDVAPEEADYRVEIEASRDERYPVSTHHRLVWTFRSGHIGENTPAPLPVSVVRFTPRLDAHHAAPAARAFPVPVSVVPQPGSVGAPLTGLTVEFSYDDGGKWREAPVRGGLVVLRHPPGEGFVSLRATASDADGNSVEQTIIRAYRFTAGG